MTRGTLIIYDENDDTFIIGHEASGDIMPHKKPFGQMKIKELEYGSLQNIKEFKYTENGGIEVISLYEENVTADEINLALLEAEGVI